ncbi:MAG TPA: hypothetical protein VN253_26085 [Kofleriaceae bacterium]|nr:hypothetical protein [Kofleriaceae bacterium]
MAMSAPAEAAERKMLVLIDASGSMAATRPLPGGGTTTRFEDAKAAAIDRVNFYAAQIGDPLRVAVYTFQGIDLPPVQYTAGFVNHNTALDVIDCLTSTPGPSCASVPALQFGGNTPLARAMCSSADTLMAAAAVGDTKILAVASDGLENSTLTGPCEGPFGTYDGTQYVPSNSWQNNVINYFTGKSITTVVDLFEVHNLPLLPTGIPDPEGQLTPEAYRKALTAPAGSTLTPLEQFFTLLVQTTGGSVNVIFDDQPRPVLGDLDGNGCVSRADAILLARAFGPVGTPSDGRFDHNLDGVIDFADYQLQTSLINPACGPDPYVVTAPLVCKGYQELVLDGVAIGGSGAAIEVRGSCRLTIKNSLIVGGQSALKLLSQGVVSVENSIVVGASAVISVPSGSPLMCAKDSIFHGKLNLIGVFQYTDHGGNTWE